MLYPQVVGLSQWEAMILSGSHTPQKTTPPSEATVLFWPHPLLMTHLLLAPSGMGSRLPCEQILLGLCLFFFCFSFLISSRWQLSDSQVLWSFSGCPSALVLGFLWLRRDTISTATPIMEEHLTRVAWSFRDLDHYHHDARWWLQADMLLGKEVRMEKKLPLDPRMAGRDEGWRKHGLSI